MLEEISNLVLVCSPLVTKANALFFLGITSDQLWLYSLYSQPTTYYINQSNITENTDKWRKYKLKNIVGLKKKMIKASRMIDQENLGTASAAYSNIKNSTYRQKLMLYAVEKTQHSLCLILTSPVQECTWRVHASGWLVELHTPQVASTTWNKTMP